MKRSTSILAISLALVIGAGCSQAASQSADVAVPAATAPATTSASVPAAPQGAAVASAGATGLATGVDGDQAAGGASCADALDALASCATHNTCDADITMYLPATSRSSLIALENQPGFSDEAFERYCLGACEARSAKVDEAIFTKDVCADGGAAADAGAGAARTEPVVLAKTFLLAGKVNVGDSGVPLSQIIKAFGQPAKMEPTPYECGSAFEEGDIQQYTYPGFVIETDGKTAIVRSMKVGGGNKIVLSNGHAVESATEDDFKKTFGERAEKVGEAYRTSASPGGDWETAYDFSFDGGQLKQVQYWIGC